MKYLKQLSLKLRLTLLFVLIFTGSLAVFSYFLFEERVENKITEFDASLFNYAIDIAESLDIDSYGEVEFDPGIIKLNEKIFPFSLGKSFISVMDINGRIVTRSHNSNNFEFEQISESILFSVLKKGVSYNQFQTVSGQNFRVINYLLPVLKIDSPLVLHIVVPTTSIDVSKNKLKKFLVFSLAIISFFSSFMGYAFISKALQPMIEITNKTKQIEFRNLDERVPVPESKDEISDLAKTINSLFERLQLSFEAQERFVQDASHQLKTPLAIMKGELDLYKAGVKSSIEESAFLESMSQELNALVKLTNDLLILARVDTSDKNLTLGIYQIDELILTQVSRLSKLAYSKNISLNINFDQFEKHTSEELSINADQDLIGVLFYNFIENAIKYSPNNSKIEIIGELNENLIRIKVKDEGVGIKAGQEDKIFDRFYRSENTSSYHGSGLGLAICRSVALLHNARIGAQRNEGKGATFYLEIKNIKKT